MAASNSAGRDPTFGDDDIDSLLYQRKVLRDALRSEELVVASKNGTIETLERQLAAYRRIEALRHRKAPDAAEALESRGPAVVRGAMALRTYTTDYARVRLTKRGIEILHAAGREESDATEHYFHDPLWSIMKIFGPSLGDGGEPVFMGNIIDLAKFD